MLTKEIRDRIRSLLCPFKCCVPDNDTIWDEVRQRHRKAPGPDKIKSLFAPKTYRFLSRQMKSGKWCTVYKYIIPQVCGYELTSKEVHFRGYYYILRSSSNLLVVSTTRLPLRNITKEETALAFVPRVSGMFEKLILAPAGIRHISVSKTAWLASLMKVA